MVRLDCAMRAKRGTDGRRRCEATGRNIMRLCYGVRRIQNVEEASEEDE